MALRWRRFLKVYLDTNVFVSAFATRGLCPDLFQVVIADHQLIVGETVLIDEVEAVAGGADVLVTGDADLLSVAAGTPLLIVAPRAFWELLKAGPRGG